MKFDDIHIGGKEVEPVNLRFKGSLEKARQYVGEGRKVLGELKRRMQLSMIDPEQIFQNQVTKKYRDGTVIYCHSILGVDEQSDIDTVLIDTTSVGKRLRCLGYIIQGFYDLNGEEEYAQLTFEVDLPKKSTPVTVTGSGEFDGYPDFNAKFKLLPYYTDVYVSDFISRYHEELSITPNSYAYTGLGNANVLIGAGWEYVRYAAFHIIDCGDDEGNTASATPGVYGLTANLYILHTTLTGLEHDFIRSDVGYGAYYTGPWHIVVATAVFCEPSEGGIGAAPWRGVYPSGAEWGPEWTNIRRGDLMAEYVDVMNDAAISGAEATLQLYKENYQIPDIFSQDYRYLFSHLGFNPEFIRKQNNDAWVTTSTGFYFEKNDIVFAYGNETFKDKSVGNGVLFVIPMKGESKKFRLSNKIIEKNNGIDRDEQNFVQPPSYESSQWENLTVINPSDPPISFGGTPNSPTWGGPTVVDSLVPSLVNPEGFEVTPGAFLIDKITEITYTTEDRNFGIPIDVQEGEHKVKLSLSFNDLVSEFKKARVYLLIEDLGFIITEFNAKQLVYKPFNDDFSFPILEKGLSITVGEVDSLDTIVKVIDSPEIPIDY